MTRMGSALCGLLLMGATAAQAIELPAAAPASQAPVHTVQYDGPGYDGPGYGGPGYGGPGYGQPEMGPGSGGRGGRRGSAGPHRYVGYHGFRIDVGAIEGVMDPSNAIQGVEHQIDIVDRVGLSSSMMSLFRSVPIRVSASFTGGGGHYSGGPEVLIGGTASSDDRPVLLHEYMHVLHAKRMPQGVGNPTIQHFYDEAVAAGLYEQGSYMLSNRGEFFAMTASCFLNGSVARAPYTRDAIREKQPDYYAYLAHLFGRGGVAQETRPNRVASAVH